MLETYIFDTIELAHIDWGDKYDEERKICCGVATVLMMNQYIHFKIAIFLSAQVLLFQEPHLWESLVDQVL
mgnify:CR=1 FL=1